MLRELYIAQNQKTAYEESRQYLAAKYKAYATWGQDRAMPGNESFSVPYSELAKDRFLLGSPADVVGEIERYRDSLGINCLIFRMQWPGMAHGQVMRQIELMAREVVPLVKAWA